MVPLVLNRPQDDRTGDGEAGRCCLAEGDFNGNRVNLDNRHANGQDAARFPWRHVDLHSTDDGSTGVDHLGESAGRRCVDTVVGRTASPLSIWFWFGLRQRDKNIYLPCVGWMVLNGAVVVGAVIYG